MSELLSMDEPRKRFAAMMSGLDIHYDLGEGHPLLGRRMPDLDLVTADGPLRVFTLLHDARPVLLNLGEPGGFDITPWADRVQLIDAKYDGPWELPVLGAVTAPTAVLIRPDGYVAWVGDLARPGAPRRAHHLVRAAGCGVALHSRLWGGRVDRKARHPGRAVTGRTRMADRVLFISWGSPIPGREERGLEVFNDAIGICGRMQQEGRIEKFDVVLFRPNGELNGYIQLHGSEEQLAAVREDEEFMGNTADASLVVNNLRHLDGATNDEVARQVGRYQEAVGRVPQAV